MFQRQWPVDGGRTRGEETGLLGRDGEMEWSEWTTAGVRGGGLMDQGPALGVQWWSDEGREVNRDINGKMQLSYRLP